MPGEVENLINIMHLKITARMLRIMKIQGANGKVRLQFSPDAHIEPRDVFALREKVGGAMRFLPDGLELNLEGLPWDAVYKKIAYILDDLAKTGPLHV
jgi:transcription-repair coupling factor (superfamily II helicase)